MEEPVSSSVAAATASVLSNHDNFNTTFQNDHDSDPTTTTDRTHPTTTTTATAITNSTVIVPLEEFAEDVDLRLGRANGNVFHRKPGVEGVHDGQVMVRLKKKRFIVIDYSIVPTPTDLQAAAINPHVTCPDGAGRVKCVAPACTKIGIPVLLYDSEPTETASLYLRSGLCFTCQRNLNEKRRTQRKRKSDILGPNHVTDADLSMSATAHATKKIKLNGEILDLTPDALVINGPIEGVKRHGEGFTHIEIGTDLQSIVKIAAMDVELLFTVQEQYQTHHEPQQLLLKQDHHHHDTPSNAKDTAAVVYAAAAAAAAVHGDDNGNHVAGGEMTTQEAVDAATNAAVNHANMQHQQPSPDTTLVVNGLYEKAFVSLTRSLYILSQWKAAWDAATAAAAQNEAVLAVASEAAAAVAAAAVQLNHHHHDPDAPIANAHEHDITGSTTTTNTTAHPSGATTTMMPLLMVAAEEKGEGEHHHHNHDDDIHNNTMDHDIHHDDGDDDEDVNKMKQDDDDEDEDKTKQETNGDVYAL